MNLIKYLILWYVSILLKNKVILCKLDQTWFDLSATELRLIERISKPYKVKIQ